MHGCVRVLCPLGKFYYVYLGYVDHMVVTADSADTCTTRAVHVPCVMYDTGVLDTIFRLLYMSEVDGRLEKNGREGERERERERKRGGKERERERERERDAGLVCILLVFF